MAWRQRRLVRRVIERLVFEGDRRVPLAARQAEMRRQLRVEPHDRFARLWRQLEQAADEQSVELLAPSGFSKRMNREDRTTIDPTRNAKPTGHGVALRVALPLK